MEEEKSHGGPETAGGEVCGDIIDDWRLAKLSAEKSVNGEMKIKNFKKLFSVIFQRLDIILRKENKKWKLQ